MKIEKDIPIPHSRLTGNRKKYPFENMEIGDSFFVQVVNIFEKRKRASSIIACARRELPKKFISRQVDGGVRIWRIS